MIADRQETAAQVEVLANFVLGLTYALCPFPSKHTPPMGARCGSARKAKWTKSKVFLAPRGRTARCSMSGSSRAEHPLGGFSQALGTPTKGLLWTCGLPEADAPPPGLPFPFSFLCFSAYVQEQYGANSG